MCERPDELRADLMQFYGVCLDAAEGAYDAAFVACLVEQMPQDCRWRVACDPDQWWTGERLLMARLCNSLDGLIWGMADKKRRGPMPKPMGPSWVRKRGRSLPMVAMTKDELMAELSKPRRARR